MRNYFSKNYKLPTLEYQYKIIDAIKNDHLIITTKDVLQKAFIKLYSISSNNTNINKLMANYTIYREAKDSSNIENIVTNQDTMYKEFLVHNYGNEEIKIRKASEALVQAVELFKQEDYQMSIGLLEDIQAILINKEKEQGIRLCNVTIGSNENSKFFYRPPSYEHIDSLLKDWLDFFNKLPDDPFIGMAVMHYQFESIHPFLDGNGRLGRILCYLYLLKNEMITYPIIGISNYILKNKEEYYSVLQGIKISEINNDIEQTEKAWISLILFFMYALTMAIETEMIFFRQFNVFIDEFYSKLERISFFKKYKDILFHTLVIYPYTTVEYFKTSLSISEPTALKYLKELTDKNILKLEVDRGRNFYLNQKLFDILN